MSAESDSDRSATGRVVAEGAHTETASRRSTLGRRATDVYGGIKWGSAFFGWLTATGTALLLTALVTAAGTAGGLATIDGLGQNPGAAATGGLMSAIVLFAVLLIAFFCGGYVAGRMARFNGAKQGLAVWLWAIVIAVIVGILGTIAGEGFDVLANVNGLPRLPVDEGVPGAGTIVAALVAMAASLIGAVLGGLAGMRFHRRVDRSGLDQ